MPPTFTSNNVHNRPPTNWRSLGYFMRALSRVILSAHRFNKGLRHFGCVYSFATSSSAENVDCVKNVLALRYPFQIAKPIIARVSVFVIGLWPGRIVSNKGKQHQSMDTGVVSGKIEKAHPEIAFTCVRSEYFISYSPAISVAYYSSVITRAVSAFVSRNWLPYFRRGSDGLVRHIQAHLNVFSYAGWLQPARVAIMSLCRCPSKEVVCG